MPSLETYGQAIASTTLAVQRLLAAAPTELQVTARTPDALRNDRSGASVNLFLYRDELTGYRDGNEPPGIHHYIAELFYLVSVDASDPSDTDAASHRSFGTARALVQKTPVLTVGFGDRTIQAQLRAQALDTAELSSLWLASGAPFRLSFGVTATFTVNG